MVMDWSVRDAKLFSHRLLKSIIAPYSICPNIPPYICPNIPPITNIIFKGTSFQKKTSDETV